jgi:hypothetical protein
MANANEPRGQHMPQEALDEGVSVKLRNLRTIPALAVAKGKANLVALHVEQTMVGNRHPVGIAAQIIQGLLRAAKRSHCILPITNPKN